LPQTRNLTGVYDIRGKLVKLYVDTCMLTAVLCMLCDVRTII